MKLRIQELRKARGFTAQQLGDIVGLSKSYVSEIENGRKNVNQARLEKFASALRVKVVDLLDPATVGTEEHELLTTFANMSDEKRAALLSVARSMKG